MALGAQVGQVVTNFGPPEGSLIDTVFTKKCQKRSKRGYPLFLTHFWELSASRGTPTPKWPVGWHFRASVALPNEGVIVLLEFQACIVEKTRLLQVHSPSAHPL